ncbi:hypothetical protein AAU57_07355 [Nonlabens sp. YIK11]|uniref:hypothetical protein n=1 Tax=Nonlabens sp. YIK11 TaxID=1453349 RepID=UPI0006DC74DC|nr:hypothetical protein [Nonlabens sp. YIK11]KQC33149.1 hypothetical protein AAU57_07355 [Nonlabens sp. YIK11]
MNLRLIALSLFFFSICGAQSQVIDTVYKPGMDKLNLLSTHPFGIFISRISQNFKKEPVSDVTMRVQQQSGNVFQPELKAYLPEDPSIREDFSNTTWFFRIFDFQDQETTPAQIFHFEFDAVLKVYRVDLEIPINAKSELQLGLRGFIAVKGNYPFSYFSSDSSIEWFHSNVAGGEDAFGRRFYGLNQVNFEYTDASGRELSMQHGELFLGGMEVAYHYYPKIDWLEKQQIYANLALHSGWNITRFNRSVDAGVSANLLKEWNMKNGNFWKLGLGGSVLRRNLLEFDQNVDLGNNAFLGSSEIMVEWTDITDRGNYNSIGLNYQEQTRYRKKAEEDYFYLEGDWSSINAGWHNAYTTLLESLSSWTFHYTHGRERIQYFVYLKEDLKVNNAPDLESGIGVRFKL